RAHASVPRWPGTSTILATFAGRFTGCMVGPFRTPDMPAAPGLPADGTGGRPKAYPPQPTMTETRTRAAAAVREKRRRRSLAFARREVRPMEPVLIRRRDDALASPTF